MPTRSLTPVSCQQRSSRTTVEEQQSDLLRLLDRLDLTVTETRLAQTLTRSSPLPVRDRDLAAAVAGRPDLDRRRRAVLEQQITRLRCKLMAHGILCIERFGYLLLPYCEE